MTAVSTGDLVSLEAVRAAAVRLRGIVVRTPLVSAPELSAEVGAEVRLKCESLQRTGAFKSRGANNFVRLLSDRDVAHGLVTYSSGNHAQAVALAAALRGVPSVVVMPVTAPDVKREGAVRLGAEVVFEGTSSQQRKLRAEAIAQDRALTMVPPFDHPHIIAGQGTVGLEIVEDWPDVDLVVAPIGGGGLLSGVAAAVRRLRPEASIVGVEPTGSAAMRRALDAGRPVVLDDIDTIADGLAPNVVGDLTYAHVRDLVDDVVLVEDDAIRDATRFLLRRQKLVVEYSGAAAVAALRSGVLEAEGRRVAVVLSGGNLDPSLLPGLV